MDPELVARRKAEKEKYEQEIQEKQYKCLMTLLTQSKALTSFILTKVNNEVEAKSQISKCKTEPKDSPVPKKKQRMSNSTASKKNVSQIILL